MYKNNIITVVIPAYNEEEGLRATKLLLPDFIDNIVVINNNSTDDTFNVAKGIGAIVINENNKGYGAAYKAGFKNIPQNTDFIVTCDADGTYPMDDLDKILDLLIYDNFDFIICSRFPLRDENSMYWLNKFGNYCLTFIFNLLTGVHIKDSQTGMWVFRKNILNKIKLKSDGMPLSEEIKMEVVLNKDIKWREYNIGYYERTGKTKLKAFKDGWINLKYLFLKRLRIWYRKIKNKKAQE